MEKTVMNFNDLAAYTGLSKSYLYKLSSKGILPCYKPMGKVLFFDKEEIDLFLKQNKSTSAKEIESQASTYVALNRGGAK